MGITEKSISKAYSLLITSGFVGGHRYYMGYNISASILLFLFLGGVFQLFTSPYLSLSRLDRFPEWWKFIIIWLIIDFLFFHLKVKKNNNKNYVIQQLNQGPVLLTDFDKDDYISKNKKDKIIKKMIKDGTVSINDGVLTISKS